MLIQWLEYKVQKQKLGPRIQKSDGKCCLAGSPQLQVLDDEPHTERELGVCLSVTRKWIGHV